MSMFLLMTHWFEHYSVVIMTLIFIMIIAYNYWPSRKNELEQQGRIPLEDDV